MVICRCNADPRCHGKKLLFLLGLVLPNHNDNADADADVLVEWWLPSMSKESSTAPGKKKNVIDIVGPWHAFSTFAAVDLRDTQLPSVLVSGGDILIANIVLEQNETIPYTVGVEPNGNWAYFDRPRGEPGNSHLAPGELGNSHLAPGCEMGIFHLAPT